MKYNIVPVPKPRMTKRDRWAKRACVLRYWDFKDEVRVSGMRVKESGTFITFTIAMPKSWAKKKKWLMNGTPHQQKPDIDNLIKGLLDALYEDDSVVWEICARKGWGYEASIEITYGMVGWRIFTLKT